MIPTDKKETVRERHERVQARMHTCLCVVCGMNPLSFQDGGPGGEEGASPPLLTSHRAATDLRKESQPQTPSDTDTWLATHSFSIVHMTPVTCAKMNTRFRERKFLGTRNYGVGGDSCDVTASFEK